MDDMPREDRAELGPVSSEGDLVRRRRERLGMHKNELAEIAGVSRDTLAAIEAGEGFRRASLTKIERALDRIEEETGVGPEEPAEPGQSDASQRRNVVIRMGGGAVVVEGPIDDLVALEAAALRLMRAMGQVEDGPR